MTDKERLTDVKAAVREVLMSRWDPIGVSDVPEAADEYDNYVGDVCNLLHGGASDEALEKYLRDVETKRMGLTDAAGEPLVPYEHRILAVSALQNLKQRPR